MIPYGRQDISPADIQTLVDVLQSDFLTQGPQVPKFEQRVAEETQAAHGVAVNSGTSALHIACMALGLGEGDWLWTSPNTFVASANCGLYCGAQIDFVDIDPRTYNLCPDALESKLREAQQTGRLPKVLVAVHFAGQPCDMKRIHALSKTYGFSIIEDASHALGAQYDDEQVGACRYSDITVFSFHPVKIITTAEGGMATTQSAELAQKMRLYRTHGITKDHEQMRNPPAGPWVYEQIALGYNYRMPDLLAALGCSQMERLSAYIQRRRQIAAHYDAALQTFPLTCPWQAPGRLSAYHLYVIRLDLKAIAKDRLTVFQELRARQIGVQIHYIPVHTQPYFRDLGFQSGDFPHAETYYEEAISLPMYPGLTDPLQHQVVETLRDILTD